MGTEIGKRPEKSVATSSDIADGDILGRRGKKIEPVRIVSTGAVAVVAAAATDDDNDDNDDDNNENDNDNDYDDDSETNDVDDDAIDIKHNQCSMTPVDIKKNTEDSFRLYIQGLCFATHFIPWSFGTEHYYSRVFTWF
uniref:Uncharacterized protein n=1 Tax=Vespula pensylvanica TaxID=30213 RepID=A0A834P0M2_VESPE|nr:hypothetical protein H0235_008854 [Vespula pensylvanica]